MLIILLIALLSKHFPLILYYLCLSVCCGGVEVSQHTCGGQRMTWRRVTHFFYLSVPAIEVRWQASRPTEPSLSIPPLNSLSMRPFCFRCIYSSSFGTVMYRVMSVSLRVLQTLAFPAHHTACHYRQFLLRFAGYC